MHMLIALVCSFARLLIELRGVVCYGQVRTYKRAILRLPIAMESKLEKCKALLWGEPELTM